MLFLSPAVLISSTISILLYHILANLQGRSPQLRPKAHILDDPLGNPYDGLKVLLGPPYGP